MEEQRQRSGLSSPRTTAGAEQKSVVEVQAARAASGRGKGALPHTGLTHIPRVNCQALRSIRVSNKPQELPTTVIHRL